MVIYCVLRKFSVPALLTIHSFPQVPAAPPVPVVLHNKTTSTAIELFLAKTSNPIVTHIKVTIAVNGGLETELTKTVPAVSHLYLSVY